MPAGLDCEIVFGRMKRRIRNGFGDDQRNKRSQSLRTGGRRYQWRSRKEKRLILPGRMKAKVGRRIQMIFIIESGMLMGLKMRRRIKREHMVLMIQFVGKYLAIKRPAKCVRQHADE